VGVATGATAAESPLEWCMAWRAMYAATDAARTKRSTRRSILARVSSVSVTLLLSASAAGCLTWPSLEASDHGPPNADDSRAMIVPVVPSRTTMVTSFSVSPDAGVRIESVESLLT
jgi:hypothetical protein